MIAISTYLTRKRPLLVHGLIPDLPPARDHSTGLRKKVYGFFSLGGRDSPTSAPSRRSLTFSSPPWHSAGNSVHSVVSWDFALSLDAGWHSTIFAPISSPAAHSLRAGHGAHPADSLRRIFR